MAAELVGPVRKHLPQEGDGRKKPYDASIATYQRTELIQHRSPDSMASALTGEKPSSRIFTFTEIGLFSAGISVAFMDNQRRVHGYTAHLYPGDEAKQEEVNQKVWGAIEAQGHRETDGTITVDDQTGDIYLKYTSDEPSDPETMVRQVDSWTQDVRAASAVDPEDGVLQYVTQGDTSMVDFTQGRVHMVTTLDGEEGRTFDQVVENLPPVRQQDNAPTLRWAELLLPDS